MVGERRYRAAESGPPARLSTVHWDHGEADVELGERRPRLRRQVYRTWGPLYARIAAVALCGEVLPAQEKDGQKVCEENVLTKRETEG